MPALRATELVSIGCGFGNGMTVRPYGFMLPNLYMYVLK